MTRLHSKLRLLYPQRDRRFRGRVRWVLMGLLLLGLMGSIPGKGVLPVQAQLPNAAVQNIQRFWDTANGAKLESDRVQLDGYPLFPIAAPAVAEEAKQKATVSPLEQRRTSIESTLHQWANRDLNLAQLQVESTLDVKSGLPIITLNDQYLMTVTTLDAQLQSTDPERWSKTLTQILEKALRQARRERQSDFLIQQTWTAGAILLGILLIGIGATLLLRRLKRLRKGLAVPVASTHPPEQIIGSATNPSFEVLQLRQQQRLRLNGLQQQGIRLVLVASWAMGIFLLLGLFPYTRWLQPLVLANPLKIVGIGVGVYLLTRLSDELIDRLFGLVTDDPEVLAQRNSRLILRATTIAQVTKSVASLALGGAGILLMLAVIGIDLLPLLAGAGIVGLAISFAGQSVIKDVINGILILIEDQYAVGDTITVGAMSGKVESVNLRITQLRDRKGQLITVPNSTISVVENASKDWSRVDFAIDLDYQTNLDRAIAILKELADTFYRDPAWQSKILEPPEILGVDQLMHTGLQLRIWIKTQPNEQWSVSREFRRRVQLAMLQEGLEVGMPYQRMVESFTSSEQGS
jgi:moderate conductance mechanosensitive channel